LDKSYTHGVVTKEAEDGGNGGWAVLYGASPFGTSLDLAIDEDTVAGDKTRTHTREEVAYWVMLHDPKESPDIKIEKTSISTYDPINLITNPKTIPGAIVKYTISARNEGLGSTDINTVAIADKVPDNMVLCVSSVDRCSEVSFIDGTVSSTLSLSNVEYSNNNGSDFNYTPTADAQGFDATVTNVRVKLNGGFKQSDGTNHPSFTLELKMGIR